MYEPKIKEIKGYSENFENFYFTDRAIELHVEDGTGGMEKIIVADKKGDMQILDKFRQDFFPLKNIQVRAERKESKDKSRLGRLILGTTIEYKGIIKINSELKYGFYTRQKIGTLWGLFDGVKAAEIKEIK